MRQGLGTFISSTFLNSDGYTSKSGSKDLSGVEAAKYLTSRAIANRKNYSNLEHGKIVTQHDYSVGYVDDDTSETRLRPGEERAGEWHEIQLGASLVK